MAHPDHNQPSEPGVALSTDLRDPSAFPYFLWDDPMTVAEFRRLLQTAPEPERLRQLGKLLREARDWEVWEFTTPQEVDRLLPQLRKHLGRRLRFWEFLLQGWREVGLLG